MKSKFHLCRLQSQNEINVTMVENNPPEPLITPPDKDCSAAKHLIKTSLLPARAFLLSGGKPAKSGHFRRDHHRQWRLFQQSGDFVKKSFDMARTGRYYAPRSNNSSVVQSVERRTVNPYVTGSSPVRGAIFKKPAQGNLSGLFAFGFFDRRL